MDLFFLGIVILGIILAVAVIYLAVNQPQKTIPTVPPVINNTKPPIVNNTEPPVVNNTEPKPTPVPIGTEKNVIMVGDIYGSIGKTVAASVKAKNPELVVLLGDLGYDSDGGYLNTVYGDLKGRLACVIGNHDDAQVFLDYCGNAYYIKINKVLFFGLDTEGDETAQGNQAVALLKDSNFMKNITSVHIMTHKPWIAPPNSHHPASEDSGAVKMIQNIIDNVPSGLEIFADNAHNHGLAEGKANNVVIHQSGGGGRSSYDCGTNTQFPYCDNVKGFLEYVIEPDGNTTWTFYNENGDKIR